MTLSLLTKEKTGIVIVDTQEKLMQAMREPDRVTDRILKLLRLSHVYRLPVILTEQYSKWLGPTIAPVKEALSEYTPIEKLDFDCCNVDLFNSRLDAADLTNIILAGVETHICIYQTCVSLIEKGYRVHIPHHAVDSRTEDNWNIGLSLMKEAGAVITSAETIIFQIMKRAGTMEFKELMKIIK